jgi:hypothetical protein
VDDRINSRGKTNPPYRKLPNNLCRYIKEVEHSPPSLRSELYTQTSCKDYGMKEEEEKFTVEKSDSHTSARRSRPTSMIYY